MVIKFRLQLQPYGIKGRGSDPLQLSLEPDS